VSVFVPGVRGPRLDEGLRPRVWKICRRFLPDATKNPIRLGH
jgi:hypothetical protein